MTEPLSEHRRKELALAERLAELNTELNDLAEAATVINDPALCDSAFALVLTGRDLLALSVCRQLPVLADALATLKSGLRRSRIPFEDRGSGRPSAIRALRGAQGGVLSAIDSCLEAAAALGAQPTEEIAADVLVPIGKDGDRFAGLAADIDNIVESLSALDQARMEDTQYVAQNGMINFYIKSMRFEVDLANLQLRFGETAIDLAAIARAATGMLGLTADFIETLRRWPRQVAPAITAAADLTRLTVCRFAAGTATMGRLWYSSTSQNAAEPSNLAVPAPPPPAPDFAPPPGRAPQTYVSYAWGDDKSPEGIAREQAVNELCEAALAAGRPIIRDKVATTYGDSISEFMARIAEGDRIVIILSAKYLQSPFCMRELHEVWRTSKANPASFRARIRVHALPDAKIFETKDRFACAMTWKARHEELEVMANQKGGLIGLGTSGAADYYATGRFYRDTADILAAIADMVMPEDFADFLRHTLAP